MAENAHSVLIPVNGQPTPKCTLGVPVNGQPTPKHTLGVPVNGQPTPKHTLGVFVNGQSTPKPATARMGSYLGYTTCTAEMAKQSI